MRYPSEAVQWVMRYLFGLELYGEIRAVTDSEDSRR